jgi:hypothetical protein
MTKTRKIGVIAVATLLSALSLPRSSSAQGGFPGNFYHGPEYGSYTGFDTYEISEYVSNQLVASYSGGGPATLTLGANYMEIGPIYGTGVYQTPYSNPPFFDPFGPTSTAGGFGGGGGFGGFSSGNFVLTYQSILPDGQIDVGNGTAVADLTSGFYYEIPGTFELGETVGFATFTTVPEPSSIVPAALAVLVIAVVAWMRGFCRRPRARLS